jgi:hypothetical protein
MFNPDCKTDFPLYESQIATFFDITDARSLAWAQRRQIRNIENISFRNLKSFFITNLQKRDKKRVTKSYSFHSKQMKRMEEAELPQNKQ